MIVNRYRLLSVFLCLFSFLLTVAQEFPPKNYPQGYFRDPLAIPINLSGNFGELRPNHFHMGLDIKTMARVNLPVYAAADGYIARIKIEPAGFGRAIYINHPNGFTTLYAHLNDFSPALEAYLKQQQYRQQSWKVFLELPPSLFPIKKGDFIANSGTTGGSQAPHLHFEVRRTSDDVNLNPLLFGMPLSDQVKPSILRLAIYDRSKSTYEQSPRIIPLKKSATGYITTPSLLTVSASHVSFAITAYDTHNGSTNLNGIYEVLLYDNGKFAGGFQIDQISYNETRYINAHIDYKTRAGGGSYLQHISELPGYVNSIYSTKEPSGIIDLSDETVHQVRILVKDAYSNTSELQYAIQYNGAVIKSALPPGKMFFPLMVDISENEDCEFIIGENCLYDSVHVRYARTVSTSAEVKSAVHAIGSISIPVQESFTVRIKPTQVITAAQKERIVMQRTAGADHDVEKVEWQGAWADARFREFGNFQLLLDEEPPAIIPVGLVSGNLARASRLAFTIRDNLESFKNFRAELDGNWLRFTNDKGRTFIYSFDEKCPPGQHSLKISVEDEAGNVALKEYEFTR